MNFLSDSDFSADEEILGYLDFLAPGQRRHRENLDVMQYYNNANFMRRYRLTKDTVNYLCLRLDNQLRLDSDNALTVHEQVLTTLRYYATGTFQSAVGDLCSRIHQTTAGKAIHRVSRAIASLRPEFITFPTTREEQDAVVVKFYDIAGMPNVLATIDCTHIRCIGQGGDYGELFRNRKGYFSLNVQTMCDPELYIRDIVSRWYGSSHDSTIFANCERKASFDAGHYGDYYILGDGGYMCSKYLLTPLLNPTTPAERAYNASQIKTRNTVERQYGVWKRRFPCLDLGIRSPYLANIQAIITATAVLHNIALSHNNPEPPQDAEVVHRVNLARQQFPPVPAQRARAGDNTAVRTSVILNHFTQRIPRR